VVLQVTAKGRREIARVHQAAMAAIVPALAELDAPTRAALRQALPKLGAALARRREAERV
jgi:DNA-binding MarR family transcriptional regulator